MFGTGRREVVIGGSKLLEQVHLVRVVIGKVDNPLPIVADVGDPSVELPVRVRALGRMDHHGAVRVWLPREVTNRNASEEKLHSFEQGRRGSVQRVVGCRDLRLGNVADHVWLVQEELGPPDIPCARVKNLRKVGREDIDNADEQRGLGRGGVLKIGMVRQQGFQGQQAAVGGALVTLLDERVQSGLVALIIDDKGWDMLYVDLLKHVNQVL